MEMVLIVALMLGGLVLLAIEVLVIPGFGVIGVLGLAAIAGALYLAYAELSPTYAGLVIAGSVVVAGLLFWLLPKTKLGKTMILDTQTSGTSADPGLAKLLDREGTALTPLRPSGSVLIDDRPVDVVTDGEYVEPGTRVRVVNVEGSRVVVEAIS